MSNSKGVNRPKKVHGQLNATAEFYRDKLWRCVKGIFDVRIPEEWDYNYTIDNLLRQGVIAITDSKLGVMPFVCSPFGRNYMNNPTEVNIAVPTILQFKRTIGTDCELLFLERKYGGSGYFTFQQTVDNFAVALASCDAARDVNLLNSRVAFVAQAENKAQAETLYKMYDMVMDGNPIVIYRKGSLDQMGLQLFFNNIKQNFIVIDVQDAKRTIMNEFLTAIGINNANTDKKERLVTSEVEANNVELRVNTDVIAKNLEIQMDKIHKMFPELKSTFSIELKYRKELEEALDDIDRNNAALGDTPSRSGDFRGNGSAD